jgi:hypothetical protein
MPGKRRKELLIAMKCDICHTRPIAWDWLPFGPAQNQMVFFPNRAPARNAAGGVAVIRVCDPCKEAVQLAFEQQQGEVSFRYKQVTFLVARGLIVPVTGRSGSNLPVRPVDLIGCQVEESSAHIDLNSRNGWLTVKQVQLRLADGRTVVCEPDLLLPFNQCRWQMEREEE